MSTLESDTPESDMERALAPEQMSLDQLLIAAKPIADGTAELGFVVEHASSIARSLIACREPVEIAIRSSFTNLAGRKCWKCPSCMTVSVWVGSKFCSDCGKEIKWTN